MRTGIPETHRAPFWQSGMCVLLVALLLYNPFIALYCSHGPNSVHSPERNRATVGSSELQHLGSIHDTQQPDLTMEENRDERAVPVASNVARGFEREEEVPQQAFFNRVWSRPPPTL